MSIKKWTITIAVVSILIGAYRVISEKPIQDFFYNQDEFRSLKFVFQG